jgi:hypothetical protein
MTFPGSTGGTLQVPSLIYPQSFPRKPFPLHPQNSGTLTHSWELGLQIPGHIHTPVGHACRVSRGLVSSKISWFCLEPGSIQLPSTTSRRFPYLGHLGLTVWDAIISEEGLRTLLPFSQQAANQWWRWKRMWHARTHARMHAPTHPEYKLQVRD